MPEELKKAFIDAEVAKVRDFINDGLGRDPSFKLTEKDYELIAEYIDSNRFPIWIQNGDLTPEQLDDIIVQVAFFLNWLRKTRKVRK
jgi:hypothetical protein